LCWTERADDYSAPRRASASVCLKTKNPARRPAESSIIAYFSRQRYLVNNMARAAPARNRAESHEKNVLRQTFWTILDLSFSQRQDEHRS
jgi:hypothetical protein